VVGGDARVEAFLAARGDVGAVDLERLAAALDDVQRTAEAAWPDVNVDPVAFARHLGERVGEGDPVAGLARLHTRDLWLARGVLDGDARAHRLLDRELVDRLVPALTALAVSRDVVDETQQRLRQMLLLPRPGGPPRLATFDGRGSLWSWARVVAVREALALAKRHRPVVSDDVVIAEALGDDPELRFLKGTYRQAFAKAFAGALSALEAKPRTALKFHHVDRLSLERTAELLGVHRATAARWLARARAELLETTRRGMMDDLSLDAEQLDSIMDLIASRFEVSVARLLEG
jgi:RNA polymerase sigma-70 factor, ECF subfamily